MLAIWHLLSFSDSILPKSTSLFPHFCHARSIKRQPVLNITIVSRCGQDQCNNNLLARHYIRRESEPGTVNLVVVCSLMAESNMHTVGPTACKRWRRDRRKMPVDFPRTHNGHVSCFLLPPQHVNAGIGRRLP